MEKPVDVRKHAYRPSPASPRCLATRRSPSARRWELRTISTP